MDTNPPKNDVLPPGSLLKYPTYPQMVDFDRQRTAGMITVFRVRDCDSCGREIPDAFECCSSDCYAKAQLAKKVAQ